MIRRALPLLAGVVSLALLGNACGLPDIEDYRALPLAQTSFLYAADGSLITELHAAEDRVVLRRGQMTRDVRDAAVAIEDRRFYFHHGVDVQAILRAAVVNAEAGTVVEGGSTITQQLVKNLYVGDEESFRRKIDEASLAWQLEDRFTKDQILTKYLNTVYFGEGAYGVEAAAQTYFGIPAVVNAEAGTVVEGGSTITQQLVKNLYVGDEESFRRKIDEASLAWQLEDRLTKDQILTKYLNTVYFGEGAYGVEAAAQTYFGIPAEALTLAQSALLAGLITAPNHFDPYVRIRSAHGRRNVVLRLMLKQEMITRDEFRAARHEPIVVRHATPVQRYPYPYFVDYFKQWFLGNPAFGPTRDARAKLMFTGGLHITTTLEPDLQKYAQTAVRSVLAYPNDPSGAMTVLDPRTGYVRAMVGGDNADYWKDQAAGRVNLATGEGGTGRQSGSSFKPFALVAALEHGISPATVFAAPATIQIPLDNGQVWNVTNAEGSGYGSMTLESATINSVNTVYAQLIEQLGADTVVEAATRMGLRCCPRVSQPRTPLLPYLSAVLGTNEVNTLEMSSAYGTLATGGQHVNPVPVIRVTDAKGNVLWEAHPKPKQVVDPQVASVANQILEKVVLYGTGTSANIGRPQIGKTGTADTHTNAWFVGSLPQLTAAVWVGFPRAAIPMEPPTTRITVFGGTWPAQIWRLFMLKAAEDLPVRSFPTPDVGYVTVAVDLTQDPYCLPNPYTLPQNIDYLDFIEGTEPTKTCTTPTSLQSVTVPSVIGMTQARAEEVLSEAGFVVGVTVTPSTQPPGTVIYQTPAAGTDAYQTSSVTITVSMAESPSP